MYHGAVGFDQLKCDSTVLQNSQDGTRVILLLNFNLPKAVVEEREEELPRRLTEIKQFLTQNLPPPLQVYYQMSASYWLQHRISQDRQRWVGSFFARDTRAASLTGPIFLDFSPATFVEQGLESLRETNIDRSLTVNFLDSAWHFVDLISVIVNCQILVPVNHPFITQHGFLQQNTARRRRRHHTFFPFHAAGPAGQEQEATGTAQEQSGP
jgi:hypothetical protein